MSNGEKQIKTVRTSKIDFIFTVLNEHYFFELCQVSGHSNQKLIRKEQTKFNSCVIL